MLSKNSEDFVLGRNVLLLPFVAAPHNTLVVQCMLTTIL